VAETVLAQGGLVVGCPAGLVLEATWRWPN